MFRPNESYSDFSCISHAHVKMLCMQVRGGIVSKANRFRKRRSRAKIYDRMCNFDAAAERKQMGLGTTTLGNAHVRELPPLKSRWPFSLCSNPALQRTYASTLDSRPSDAPVCSAHLYIPASLRAPTLPSLTPPSLFSQSRSYRRKNNARQLRQQEGLGCSTALFGIHWPLLP